MCSSDTDIHTLPSVTTLIYPYEEQIEGPALLLNPQMCLVDLFVNPVKRSFTYSYSCKNMQSGDFHRKKMNGERHLLKMSLSSCSAQGCEAIFISSVDSGFCVQQQSHTVCGFLTESRCNSPLSARMSQVLDKLWRDSNS